MGERTPDTKVCEHCGTIYRRGPNTGRPEWATRRFCSRDCSRRHRAPFAHKLCEWCGVAYARPRNEAGVAWARRRFCSHACSESWLAVSLSQLPPELHASWKGDAVKENSARNRARRKLRELGACADCGGTAVDRHHHDGDPRNNDLANIIPLCRNCHRMRHGGSFKPRMPRP